MKTLILGTAGCLLALTALVGCSDDGRDDESTRGTDSSSTAPSDSASDTPSSDDSASGDFTEVEIVHATEGGGSSQPAPLPLATDAEVADFVADLSEELAGKVRDAVESVDTPPDGQVVAGQIVGIGCEVPTTVTLVDGSLQGVHSKGPEVQCIAPVTSVAIVTIDEDIL